MSKVINVLLVLFLIVGVTICLVLVVNRVGFSSNSDLELVDSYEVEVGDVDKLFINIFSVDIFYKESENDKILIEYYSNVEDKDVKFEKIDRQVNVEEIENKDNNVIINKNNKIIVYVPLSYEGEYEIKTKSGDIKSEINFLNNKTEIDTNSGDIALKNINSANIKTSSGDIIIGNATNNISIVTIDGDVKVESIEKNVNIVTSSGDVTINKFNITENSSINTVSGDVDIKENTSVCYIETKTTSGDVKINKNDRKSDVVLKIETTSGDINVD